MTLLFPLLFCGDWCVSMAEEAIIAKWDSSSESSLQMLSKVILAASGTVFDCCKCKQNAPLVTRLVMAMFSNGQNSIL